VGLSYCFFNGSIWFLSRLVWTLGVAFLCLGDLESGPGDSKPLVTSERRQCYAIGASEICTSTAETHSSVLPREFCDAQAQEQLVQNVPFVHKSQRFSDCETVARMLDMCRQKFKRLSHPEIMTAFPCSVLLLTKASSSLVRARMFLHKSDFDSCVMLLCDAKALLDEVSLLSGQFGSEEGPGASGSRQFYSIDAPEICTSKIEACPPVLQREACRTQAQEQRVRDVPFVPKFPLYLDREALVRMLDECSAKLEVWLSPEIMSAFPRSVLPLNEASKKIAQARVHLRQNDYESCFECVSNAKGLLDEAEYLTWEKRLFSRPALPRSSQEQ